MRFVTKEQAERDITSWENKYHTRRALYLDREPTLDELMTHYMKFNIIVKTVDVYNSKTPSQNPG